MDRRGAPWPDEAQRLAIERESDRLLAADGLRLKTSTALSQEWANRRYKPDDLWAYRPVSKPAAPERPAGIDHLIEDAMPEGLEPAPRADARMFIRRATFDLLGLPPTPKEAEAFEEAFASDAERAKSDLVERLLSSPHYG